MSEFKAGDRVRVTWEGELFYANERYIESARNTFHFDTQGLTIEKLAPPEPAWEYGDVVKVEGYYPFLRGRREDGSPGWRAPFSILDDFDRIVSEAWQHGTLKVLHKMESMAGAFPD